MLRRLPRKTVLLPFFVPRTDEGLDGRYVVCGKAGVGVVYQFSQRPFIGRYAQDGFLASKCFVELGSQHAVCVSGGKDAHNAALPDGITHVLKCDRLFIRSVNLQTDRQSGLVYRLLYLC